MKTTDHSKAIFLWAVMHVPFSFCVSAEPSITHEAIQQQGEIAAHAFSNRNWSVFAQMMADDVVIEFHGRARPFAHQYFERLNKAQYLETLKRNWASANLRGETLSEKIEISPGGQHATVNAMQLNWLIPKGKDPILASISETTFNFELRDSNLVAVKLVFKRRDSESPDLKVLVSTSTIGNPRAEQDPGEAAQRLHASQD